MVINLNPGTFVKNAIIFIRILLENMYIFVFQARVCDPLGDLNIWASLKPMYKSSPPLNRSLIIVAARVRN